MQTLTYENPGQELDAKARRFSAEKRCTYAEAFAVVKAEAPELFFRYVSGESDLDREVRKGGEEFSRRVVAYQEEWNLSRDEARRRVASHDPAMKCYEQDPYASIPARGETAPLPSSDWQVSEMPVGENRVTALMQIGVLLGGIPRNPNMSISFDAAARVLQAGYLDLLVKAASEKMDYYARSEISILGLPGFSSENYKIGFDSARRKYPALTQIYSGGRISLQGLKELLPHLQLVD